MKIEYRTGFFRPPVVKYILAVGSSRIIHMSRIRKKTKMQFLAINHLTSYLKDLDIVKTKKVGRCRIVELTVDGKEIYICLKKISSIVDKSIGDKDAKINN